MIGSNTTSNGIYENSFASLLFPDKPPVKKKRPHSKKPESSTKAVPPPSIIPKKPEIKPTNNNVSHPQPHQHKTNPQHHHQSQSNHHKTHSNTIAKNIAPVTKKKESNSLLDKLKNFDSLEALENEIEKNLIIYACSSFIFAKHSLQYTGRSSRGWNGTRASPPQAAQVAVNISLSPLAAFFLASRQGLQRWGSFTKPFSA